MNRINPNTDTNIDTNIDTDSFPRMGAGLDDQRVARRSAVHFYIAVKRDNTHLGHLVNLSASGMAVVGRLSLEPEQSTSLRLEADLGDGHFQTAEFAARCVFSIRHRRPSLFISGFEFQTLTPKARLRVKNILRALQS